MMDRELTILRMSFLRSVRHVLVIHRSSLDCPSAGDPEIAYMDTMIMAQIAIIVFLNMSILPLIHSIVSDKNEHQAILCTNVVAEFS